MVRNVIKGSGSDSTLVLGGSKGHVRCSLSKIPEVIDPGITVPIYEEDILEDQESGSVEGQPQKIGSYRAKAGKFSNTLSNLLPSISARLHYNWKSSGNITKNIPSVAGGEVLVENCSSLAEKPECITPPQDMINLSDQAFTVSGPRFSNDSYKFDSNSMYNGQLQIPGDQVTGSRTRNNTVSSQITSISSMCQFATPDTNNIWTPVSVPQQDQINMIGLQFNSTQCPDNAQSNYYNMMPQQHTPGLLSIPDNNAMLREKRTRSKSNASSVYTDAQMFDSTSIHSSMNPSRSRASTFASTTLPESVSNNGVVSNNGIVSTAPVGLIVQDDIDFRSLSWVSTDPTVPVPNQISHLLPSNTISISNVFPLQQQQLHLSNALNLTSTSLANLCLNFGKVISARTLRMVNMALVEFDCVEAATRAKDTLNGKDVSLVGAPSAVFFAKILSTDQNVDSLLSASTTSANRPQSLLQEQLYSGAVTFQQHSGISIPIFNFNGINIQQQQLQQHISSQAQTQQHVFNNQTLACSFNSLSNTPLDKEHCPFQLPPVDFKNQIPLLQKIIKSFNVDMNDSQISHIISHSLSYDGTSDIADFGLLPKPLSHREFDAPRLRELRKLIDADNISGLELEQLAITMLEELPELSSDYLGNTIVQKFFEYSSTLVKDIMLRQTSKYLTSMGVHKNGTWACQKMVTMADTPRQKDLVAKSIYKYCTPLLNDQFGNYVIQCILRFGFPWNNFIFESIVANFYTIVQNRYGARAVRACLEAHEIITHEQLLVLSGMILLYVEYLATNSNGALLVTWFLDTCTLPSRHSVLIEMLLPHIVELCCDRLASLTILKILSLRSDQGAKKSIFDKIFGPIESHNPPPQALYEILGNANHGSTFIYKVLSTPLFEGEVRNHAINQVLKVLLECNCPHHRRLMEEFGLNNNNSTKLGVNSTPSSAKQGQNVPYLFPADKNEHIRAVSANSNRSTGSVSKTLNINQSITEVEFQQATCN